MRHTTGTRKSHGEKIVKDIKRATRKQYSSEEKIRIVLDGLRGEVVLSRFSSGLFRAIIAMKENRNDNQIYRRISP